MTSLLYFLLSVGFFFQKHTSSSGLTEDLLDPPVTSLEGSSGVSCMQHKLA